VKRGPHQFTVSALAGYLRKSRARTLALIKAAGIELTPVEIHYSDDRPRTRRNWRPLTAQETDRVIAFVRAKQGAKL
jgi:hypothetical protein